MKSVEEVLVAIGTATVTDRKRIGIAIGQIDTGIAMKVSQAESVVAATVPTTMIRKFINEAVMEQMVPKLTILLLTQAAGKMVKHTTNLLISHMTIEISSRIIKNYLIYINIQIGYLHIHLLIGNCSGHG